jgi:hypothetical protein
LGASLEEGQSPSPAVGRAVIPFAALTPGACDVVADTADEAMDVFAAWDIPLPKQERLRQAVRLLRKVAAARSWGTTEAERARVAAALSVAGDFILIAQCLRGDPVAAISEEIRTALGQGLAALAQGGGHSDLQSQYWFGMLLARAGLRPRVPRAGERRPDFVVGADTMDFGVEHKRPRTEHSAPGALDKAAGQLRDYGDVHHTPGVIVMNLSDAVGVQRLAGTPLQTPGVERHLIGELFQAQADRLDWRAQTNRLSDKYDRIVGIICYARALLWPEQPAGLVPTFTAWVVTYIMERGCHGIIQDSVRRLFRSLKNTIEEFGDAPVRQLPTSRR